MYQTYGSSYFFRTEIAFRSYSDSSFQLPANTNVMFDGAGHWHGSGRALNRMTTRKPRLTCFTGIATTASSATFT